MTDTLTTILKGALFMPQEAQAFELSLRLAQMFPTKYILETSDSNFDLQHFHGAGRCTMRTDLLSHVQLHAIWKGREKGGYFAPRNGAYDVAWNGETLRVVRATHECGPVHFILADTPEIAKEFFAAVCRAVSEVSGQILVFSRGYWRQDPDLVKDIANSTVENLILSDEMLEALRTDVCDFFEAKETYASLGVPWKRGVLMLGPPGNGKTHAIKAMVNELRRPCLYVRSFATARGTVQGSIEGVFHRARESSPCILVFEDLDSLIDNKCRSFFLNEMDGFAANEGILTIATTNHPEKLDVALLERPSRFDRKITFGLPSFGERRRFLEMMLRKGPEERRVSGDDVKAVTLGTEGFSFAYLKELCLSAQMAWMRTRAPGAMGDALLSQIQALRTQMQAESRPRKAVVVDEEEDEKD